MNNMWDLCQLPTEKKKVGCKWMFTVKLKADGSIDRYKARLVTKGYTQKYRVDYQETFAPVAKMNTILIRISIVVNRDWPYNNLMSRMLSLMEILRKKFTWSYHLELKPGPHAELKYAN